MNILRAWRSSTLVHKRSFSCQKKPQHLICFKQWSADMVMAVLCSAINLKHLIKGGGDMSCLLAGSKILTLQEVNQPWLSCAISKAASMLGAHDVTIVDKIQWDHDYNGKIFSYMSDAIFVTSESHTCLQRFAERAHVPVLCTRSRTHATVQAMATFMAVFEQHKTFKNLNIAYLGPWHQVLNSYLLLCPMLGAHFNFMCCCSKTPVSPVLKKAGEDLCEQSHTHSKECASRDQVFKGAHVIIAGPTTKKPENLDLFRISVTDMEQNANKDWLFFHTFPHGKEVDDVILIHSQSKAYDAFENMPFIVGALMAFVLKDHRF